MKKKILAGTLGYGYVNDDLSTSIVNIYVYVSAGIAMSSTVHSPCAHTKHIQLFVDIYVCNILFSLCHKIKCEDAMAHGLLIIKMEIYFI